MKQKATLPAVLFLLMTTVTIAFLLRFPTKKGTLETWCNFHGEKIGSVYILGRYEGFFRGWDVAFFHQDEEGQWHGYYLAHEARNWRRPKLQVEGSVFIVNDGRRNVAEYDAAIGRFTHKIQGVTYSKKDGLDGGREVVRWKLVDADKR